MITNARFYLATTKSGKHVVLDDTRGRVFAAGPYLSLETATAMRDLLAAHAASDRSQYRITGIVPADDGGVAAARSVALNDAAAHAYHSGIAGAADRG